MYKYKIRYLNTHELTCTAIIYSETEEEALQHITDLQKVIHISNCGKNVTIPNWVSKLTHLDRLSPRELADILRHLAYARESGLSTQESFNILATTGNTKQISFCSKILQKLKDGYSLAESIQEYEGLLPINISAIIKASSESGKLNTMLHKLADQLENNIAITNRIRTAMIYPVIVLLIAAGVTWFLFTNIIPQVADVLLTIGDTDLPVMTQAILAVSALLEEHILMILLCVVGVIVLLKLLSRNKKRYTTSFVMKIPYINTIVRDGELTKFFSQFSFLLQAGFTIQEALIAGIDVVDNKFIRHRLHKVEAAISKGYSVSDAFHIAHILGVLEMQVIRIGNTAGTLSEVCSALSKQLSTEAERRTQNLLKILEPTIMLVVGCIVGVIMIAIYQPLFEMMTLI